LVSACFWLPGLLKKWQLEETKYHLDKALMEREALKEAEAADEMTDSSEKSKDDFEKIAEAESMEQEEEEIVDETTKKNK
jgi:hypothetical protein